MPSYDAVVIGAGHNGLVAATLLAKSRFRVLVVEAASTVGGMAKTVEFAPGFRVSHVAHLLTHLDRRLAEQLSLDSHGLGFAATGLPTVALAAAGQPLKVAGARVFGDLPPEEEAAWARTQPQARPLRRRAAAVPVGSAAEARRQGPRRQPAARPPRLRHPPARQGRHARVPAHADDAGRRRRRGRTHRRPAARSARLRCNAWAVPRPAVAGKRVQPDLSAGRRAAGDRRRPGIAARRHGSGRIGAGARRSQGRGRNPPGHPRRADPRQERPRGRCATRRRRSDRRRHRRLRRQCRSRRCSTSSVAAISKPTPSAAPAPSASAASRRSSTSRLNSAPRWLGVADARRAGDGSSIAPSVDAIEAGFNTGEVRRPAGRPGDGSDRADAVRPDAGTGRPAMCCRRSCNMFRPIPASPTRRRGSGCWTVASLVLERHAPGLRTTIVATELLTADRPRAALPRPWRPLASRRTHHRPDVFAAAVPARRAVRGSTRWALSVRRRQPSGRRRDGAWPAPTPSPPFAGSRRRNERHGPASNPPGRCSGRCQTGASPTAAAGSGASPALSDNAVPSPHRGAQSRQLLGRRGQAT